MNLIDLVVFWLSASACRTQIIREASKYENLANLAELTVEILSSCYEQEVKTIGLAGNSYDALFVMLSSKMSVPIVLIGKDNDRSPPNPKDLKLRHKLQLFVLSASSSTELEQIVRQIKISHWWNHMGTYWIHDSNDNSLKDGCSNAFSYLSTAWQMDLLKGFYVCLNQTQGRIIYSYNPFTNKAPEPWHLENTYIGKNNHPWSLFRRDYDVIDDVMCLNLNFDRTIDLGGFEIYSTIKEMPTLMPYVNETVCNKFSGYMGRITTAVFHALNATARLKRHNVKNRGLSDSFGRDIAIDTIIGISDILLIPRYHSSVSNYTVSCGFRETGLRVMTQYTGQQTQLEQLIRVLDRSSRYCLLLVILTTVIFFKFFLRQSFVTAILNVFRIASYSTLPKLPKNQGARIYLAGIFILVVTIIGIYQGQLSSLLTMPKELSNVESIKDLAEGGYTIHGHKTYARLFTDPSFKGRYISHESYNCTDYVLQDPLAACVRGQEDIIRETANFTLHLSRSTVAKNFAVYVIRENWPIEERFNFVLAALTEADIPRLTYHKEVEMAFAIAKFKENHEKDDKFDTIRLNDLSFAFAFLGIGLGCASVCFVIEITILKPS